MSYICPFVHLIPSVVCEIAVALERRVLVPFIAWKGDNFVSHSSRHKFPMNDESHAHVATKCSVRTCDVAFSLLHLNTGPANGKNQNTNWHDWDELVCTESTVQSKTSLIWCFSLFTFLRCRVYGAHMKRSVSAECSLIDQEILQHFTIMNEVSSLKFSLVPTRSPVGIK